MKQENVIKIKLHKWVIWVVHLGSIVSLWFFKIPQYQGMGSVFCLNNHPKQLRALTFKTLISYPSCGTLVGYFSGMAGVHNLQPCFFFDVLWSHPLPGTEKIKDTRFYQMELLSTVCNALFFIRNTHSVTMMPQETQCSFKPSGDLPRYPDENGFIQTSHQPAL